MNAEDLYFLTLTSLTDSLKDLFEFLLLRFVLLFSLTLKNCTNKLTKKWCEKCLAACYLLLTDSHEDDQQILFKYKQKFHFWRRSLSLFEFVR